MKTIIAKSGILIAAGLAACALAVAAPPTHNLMRIDIPFSFFAGEKSMPAGTYWVRLDVRAHTLDLTAANVDAYQRFLVTEGYVTRKQSAAGRGVLSFRRYGSTLVLKGVFAPGDTAAFNLPASRAEAELAKTTTPAISGEASVDVPYR